MAKCGSPTGPRPESVELDNKIAPLWNQEDQPSIPQIAEIIGVKPHRVVSAIYTRLIPATQVEYRRTTPPLRSNKREEAKMKVKALYEYPEGFTYEQIREETGYTRGQLVSLLKEIFENNPTIRRNRPHRPQNELEVIDPNVLQQYTQTPKGQRITASQVADVLNEIKDELNLSREVTTQDVLNSRARIRRRELI